MFETLNASAAGTSCALGVGGRSLLKNGVEPGLDSTSLLKAEVFRGDGLGRLGERMGKSGVVVLLSILVRICNGEGDFGCGLVFENVVGARVVLL